MDHYFAIDELVDRSIAVAGKEAGRGPIGGVDALEIGGAGRCGVRSEWNGKGDGDNGADAEEEA